MNVWKTKIVAGIVCAFCASSALAAPAPPPTTLPMASLAAKPATELAAAEDPGDPQPILCDDATWAGVVLIAAAGLFVAAACIGPIIHLNLGPDIPPNSDSDERKRSSR
jgi:hypothetical protein